MIVEDVNHNKIFALQAQVHHKIYGQVDRDRDYLDRHRGSATVEASLVLPFFLCAVCTICVIAQFLLADATIYHATLQTARIYAKQESASAIHSESGGSADGSSGSGSSGSLASEYRTSSSDSQTSALKKLGGIVKKQVIFSAYLDKNCLNSSFVLGGKSGVSLSTDTDEDYIVMKSSYVLKVPVPYFKFYYIHRSIKVRCRRFQGYILHDSEQDSSGADVVYVAQYGSVYHTSLDCYHLTVHITDPDKVKKIMESSHYRKCEKCMKDGTIPSQVYTTKDGDCYHSTLSCSGLKRSVTAVKKSEVAGMRECSECAKKSK